MTSLSCPRKHRRRCKTAPGKVLQRFVFCFLGIKFSFDS